MCALLVAFCRSLEMDALVLLSPLMLLIALAVKMSSPGPIIFRQRRYGLYGEQIYVYKFRSMTTLDDADAIAAFAGALAGAERPRGRGGRAHLGRPARPARAAARGLRPCRRSRGGARGH